MYVCGNCATQLVCRVNPDVIKWAEHVPDCTAATCDTCGGPISRELDAVCTTK